MAALSKSADRCRRHSRSFLSIVCVALSVLPVCTGCLLTRYYIDPQQVSVGEPLVTPSDQPCEVTIDVELQSNGSRRFKWAGYGARKKISEAIVSSGVFAKAKDDSDPNVGHLHVVVNDTHTVGDLAVASTKGFVTGYTLGLIGNNVAANNEITMTYEPPVGEPVTRTYNRTMYAAIGLWSAPEGKERVAMADLWKREFEGVLFDYRRDPNVQVAMAEQRRLQHGLPGCPGTSAPQIATLPPTTAVQPVGLTEKLPGAAQPTPTPLPAVR